MTVSWNEPTPLRAVFKMPPGSGDSSTTHRRTAGPAAWIKAREVGLPISSSEVSRTTTDRGRKAQGLEGPDRELDEHDAGLHVEDAGTVGLAVLDPKGHAGQRADGPDGVEVAKNEEGRGQVVRPANRASRWSPPLGVINEFDLFAPGR